MRKRGANFKHRTATVPGLVVQSTAKDYETRLRMAVESFRGGWAAAAHFNDLADCLDLMRLALEILPGQQPDPNAEAVAELALVALQNIRLRHETTGRMGVTGDELQALVLLVDTSLDYWNRRSGALFSEAYRQLMKARRQHEEMAA